MNGKKCRGVLLGIVIYVACYAANSETILSTDGSFSFTWSEQWLDSGESCVYYEIEATKVGAGLYQYVQTPNCSSRLFSASNYPDGQYEITVTQTSVIEEEWDFFEQVAKVVQLTVGVEAGTSKVVAMNFESGLQSWRNTTSYRWIVDADGTPSGGTGPNVAAQGSYYAYVETSSGQAYHSGNTAELESPTLLISGTKISFRYHMYGANTGSLFLDLWDGDQWSTLWSRSGQQQSSGGASWGQATVDAGAFTGAGKIRFKVVAVGGYRGDIAIDDIRVETAGNIVSYQYDALGRLIEVHKDFVLDEKYNYDKAGNRTSVTKQ